MDVFDLVAKISLDSGPFERGLDKASGKMSVFGDIFKANIASDLVQKGFGAIVNGSKKAVDGITGLVKEATQAYGNYEQLVGGVEKLYGDAAGKVEEYAKNAYKTSQMSANQYMETATQFSASLIQSLGGDANAAAEQTEVAMKAIADNVNVFGSNMEDVTNAFKGFSKQNYTMLDNLKLGYGGTKTEMERLIADANEYAASIGQASDLSIEKFSDVVTAIELIQEKQHIAGTTAKEATETLQGSQAMMLSAWENLKTALGSGVDVEDNITKMMQTLIGYTDEAGNHVKGFLDNLIPTIQRSVENISKSLNDAGPSLIESVVKLAESVLPPLLEGIVKLVNSIIKTISEGIANNAGAIAKAGGDILDLIAQGLITNIPLIADAIVKLLQAFNSYIKDNRKQIQESATQIINALVNGLVDIGPELAEAALEIISILGGALIDAVPNLVKQLPEFISGMWNAITDAWNNASGEEKVALAGVLIPIFTGGIKDAISGVKGAKDTIGNVSEVFSGIFGENGIAGKIKGIDFSGTADSFKMLGSSLKTVADIKIGEIGEGFKTFGTTLSSIGSTIGGGLLTGIQAVGTFITGTIVPGIAGLMTTLAPFLPLILGIVAAVTAVILVVKNWDKISKALQEGWEKLKNVASTVWNGITDTVSGAWDGIKSGVSKGVEKVKSVVGGAWDKIKSATSEKWSAIKGEVEKNGGGIKGVLKTAVKGYLAPWKAGFEALNKASGGKLGEAVKLVKEKAKDILNGIKEKFKGAAEVGSNLVKGLWNGINDKVSWIIKKVKGFGSKVLKGLKDFFKIKSPSRVMRDQIGKNLALGVAEGITKNSAYAEKSAEEMAQAIVDAAQKKLDRYELYNDGVTLADEVAYWDAVRKQIKAGTDARYNADKNYLDKKKQLQEQEKSANDSLYSSLQSAEENYQEAMQASLDKITQRKDAILSAFSLFDSFDAGDEVDKSTLIANQDSQVEALKTWADQLEELHKKLGDTDLYESIKDMGVSGLNNIVALNTMTSNELKNYAQTYENMQDMAENQAKRELAPEIEADIKTATQDYVSSVSTAWNTFESTMENMGEKVTGINTTIAHSLIKAGKDYSSALDTLNTEADTKLSSLTGVIEDSFTKLTGHSKQWGEDLVAHFMEGVRVKSKDLKSVITSSLAQTVADLIGFSEPKEGPLSDFHTYAPDMIDLFTKGIIDNGHKINEAFDSALGLDDLTGRISESMLAPAVQAAGNTMSIAGLPQLTEIAGQSGNNQSTQPTNLNITMMVGRTEFAKLVYQLNKEENQRIGLNLATGTI